MSAVPDTSLGRRTIGEILLEHGFVTKEQIDEATALQLESGRPLGQILVEAGTITRLELASALAEQWSDSGAPIAPPIGLTLSGSVPPLELSDHPASAPIPVPVQDQSELLSRLERVEAAIESLSTPGVEDVTSELRAVVGELSERLAIAEPGVEELGRRLEELAAGDRSDARLEELATAVSELQERLGALGQSVDSVASRADETAADAAGALEGVRAELSELSARIPALADAHEVEKLHELVDALSQRTTRDPDLVAELEDLQAVVEALGKRPDRDFELLAQVDALAGRLAEIGDRVDVLAAAAQTAPGDAEALEELQRALAELAQRPVVDAAAERRVDELSGAVEELRSSMAELAARPGGDPALDEKLFEIASRLEELERAEALEELRARIAELVERPQIDPLLLQRLDELERKVEAVPGDDVLEELGAGDRSLGFRIDGVMARVDELAAALEQAGENGVSREAWDEAVAVLNSRIEAEAAIGSRLSQLEERLAEIVATGSPEPAPTDPQVQEQLSALGTRVDELAAGLSNALHVVSQGGAGGEGGEGAPAAAGAPATSPALERDVEHVLMAIERLSVHLGAHERALTELLGAGGVVAQVRELAARVGDLETYGTGGGGDGSGGGGGAEMRAELRSLMRRLEDAEAAQKSDRERVIEQLEKAAGAIDWRLQRLEAVRNEEPTP